MSATTAVRGHDIDAERTMGAKALLIGAPLVMALGRVLLVPLDDQDWDGVMNSMAAHRGRSDAGWLLALAASGLLTVTAVVFANRLRLVGKARQAMFVTVTIAIGWAATAATCLGGLYLSVAATASDRAAQVQLQQDFNEAAAIAARAAVEQARDRLAMHDRALERARIALAQLVGEAASRPLGEAPDTSVLPVSRRELLVRLNEHPAVRSAERQAALAQAGIRDRGQHEDAGLVADRVLRSARAATSRTW